MECSSGEEVLDLVGHPADCRLSSAVAVVFERGSIGNETGEKTAKEWIWMLHSVKQTVFKNGILLICRSLICTITVTISWDIWIKVRVHFFLSTPFLLNVQ